MMATMSPEALRALGRLWPNREHESNWLKALFCALGFHRWHTLSIEVSTTSSQFDFCRWCPEIKPQATVSGRARAMKGRDL
jgi:hypothetical protein